MSAFDFVMGNAVDELHAGNQLAQSFEAAQSSPTVFGAHELICRAGEEELRVFLEQQAGRREADGRLAVVRNDDQSERALLTSLGPVRVQVAKVRDRSGEGAVFRSTLVPPYLHRASSVEAALQWLTVKGISIGDICDAFQASVDSTGEARAGAAAAGRRSSRCAARTC